MIPNEDIDVLSNEIQSRHDRHPLSQVDPNSMPGHNPFILFLGSDCARAAKVPNIETVAARATELFNGDDIERLKYLPTFDSSDTGQVVDALYKLLDQMSPAIIYSTLRSLFINIPVPLFYQDLALLVKEGYFNRIITTNFDTLLEQALDGAGMQAGFDYFVTSLGIKLKTAPQSSLSETDEQALEAIIPYREPVHIIKLHGDVAQQQINLSPARIEEALRRQRRFVRSELKGDMVIAGYKFENDKINDWLGSTASARERLWWVSQENGQDRVAEWAAQVAFIEGDTARPETFFSQLVLRLLRRPAQATLGKSFKDYFTSFGLGDAIEDTPEPTPPPEQASEDDLTVFELRDRISRSQSVLFSQEQAVSGGDPPPNVQAQIRYQKRQIARAEDRLRDHPDCKKRILELVGRIVFAAEATKKEIEPRTLTYLLDQVEVVQHQYEDAHPNQQIISAALSTIVILGDRLRFETGETTVPGDQLRELASYVPSLTARGVIQ